MGNTWTVSTYGPQPDGRFGFTPVWSGESVIRCIRAAIKAKRSLGKLSLVKVDWR